MDENSTTATRHETADEPTLTTNPTIPASTQGLNTATNNTRDFVAFGKANLEAVVAANKIWATGVQELTTQFANTTKASYEESVATFKALRAAKSVKEAIDLQSTYRRSAIAKAVADSQKLTDESFRLTERALAPLTARVAAVVERFAKAA